MAIHTLEGSEQVNGILLSICLSVLGKSLVRSSKIQHTA